MQYVQTTIFCREEWVVHAEPYHFWDLLLGCSLSPLSSYPVKRAREHLLREHRWSAPLESWALLTLGREGGSGGLGRRARLCRWEKNGDYIKTPFPKKRKLQLGQARELNNCVDIIHEDKLGGTKFSCLLRLSLCGGRDIALVAGTAIKTNKQTVLWWRFLQTSHHPHHPPTGCFCLSLSPYSSRWKQLHPQLITMETVVQTQWKYKPDWSVSALDRMMALL